MDQRTNDITEAPTLDDVAGRLPDADPRSAAGVGGGVGDLPGSGVPDLAADLAAELTADMSPAEVLEATRRHVERLAALDPADVVGPAGEIAEVLGRLIEEDDH
jgi:hypothetical protein